MCECFIFLYLGMGLLSFGSQATYDPLYIISASFSILVSRTHVFLILGVANWIPGYEPVPFMQQVLIWFSGLRGAVAFALGVTFLELPNFSREVKGIIFGTTVMVVVLTVIILGGLTPYMIVWLGISKPHGSDSPTKAAEEEDDYAGAAKVINKPFFGWLYRLDATYIRPHFTDLSRDNLAQIIRRMSSKNEGEFVPLKDMDKPEKEKIYTSAKIGQSEDVTLEAVSLN